MRRLHLAQGTYSNPRLWGKGFLTPVRYATGADGRSLPMVFPDLGWDQLPRPPRRRVRRPKDPEPARGRHVRLGDGVLRPGRHVRISPPYVEHRRWRSEHRAARDRPIVLLLPHAGGRIHRLVHRPVLPRFRAHAAPLVNLFLQVSLLLVAIGVTTQVTSLEDEYGGIGVVVEDTWARGSLALFATLFMSTALAVLVRTLIRNKDPIVRKQAILMTAGIVIHGTGAESYAYLRIFVDQYPPPYLTITAFAMAALFAVAVLRYRMFVVTPQKEEPVGVPRRFDLKAGHAYAIRERRPRLAFLAVAEAVRLGALGLVITRRTPTEVRDDYDLQATPILWLTSAVGQNRIPPTNPELLERLVREFVAAQPKAVVMLEGIEYLANYLEAARVVRLVNTMRDLVTAGDGVLLASADPTALDEATAGVLDREFEPLAVPEKVGYEVEDVFVIERGGLLLTHASRSDGADVDPDVMAGMLTAIMNFARVSFAGGADELRRLELGDQTVVIERSPKFILAVAITGKPPAEVQEEMRIFLERAERRYGPMMARWTGDPMEFPGLQAMTSRLFL